MIELSDATLPSLKGIATPSYDRRRLKRGIVHIGVGNFVRTHLMPYLDACLTLGGHEDWGLVGVGLSDGSSARSKAAAFREQDCLYTMTSFGPDGEAEIRVIGAMVEYLHAPANPEAVLARLAAPETRLVTLTITEGGYNIDEVSGAFRKDATDVQRDLRSELPTTTFGYLVEGLARRRAVGLAAFTIASCDNLRGSGDITRSAVLGYAEARDPSLAQWISDNVDFPNSMVDRLAPQVPESQREALNARSGVDDRVPVLTEAFTRWVVEDAFRHGRPAFERVGVEFSDTVAKQLAIKGRLLNASHGLLAYPALLLGYRFVHEGLGDPRIRRLVEDFIDEDARPLVERFAGVSLETYAGEFIARFSNPAIPDTLLRVAGDGVAKLPTFHALTLEGLIEEGRDLRREAFLFACFARYLSFAYEPAVRDDRGDRFDPFEPNLNDEDWAVLRTADPSSVLRLPAFARFHLDELAAFKEPFDRFSEALATGGAGAAMAFLDPGA